jgi:hypothetical protein
VCCEVGNNVVVNSLDSIDLCFMGSWLSWRIWCWGVWDWLIMNTAVSQTQQADAAVLHYSGTQMLQLSLLWHPMMIGHLLCRYHILLLPVLLFTNMSPFFLSIDNIHLVNFIFVLVRSFVLCFGMWSKVWDLRNSVSPLKELVGHTKGMFACWPPPCCQPLFKSKKADDVSIIICLSRKYYAELLLELIAILGCLFFVAGVLAMAWCPSDSSLLLSCAKDNRTLCWDTISGQVFLDNPFKLRMDGCGWSPSQKKVEMGFF